MTRHKKDTPASLAGMMTDLTFASWATILRRTQLMAAGKCTPAEYQRMIMEKADAASASFLALARPGAPNLHAALNPWLVKAKANAARLRKS
jgi:hypothetical protein